MWRKKLVSFANLLYILHLFIGIFHLENVSRRLSSEHSPSAITRRSGRKLLYQYEARSVSEHLTQWRPDLGTGSIALYCRIQIILAHQGMFVILKLQFLRYWSGTCCYSEQFSAWHSPALWTGCRSRAYDPGFLCLWKPLGVHFTAIACSALPSPPFCRALAHKMWFLRTATFIARPFMSNLRSVVTFQTTMDLKGF